MYKVTVAPATEIITTAELKVQARYESADTSQDTLILNKIKAARQWIEKFCGLAMISQTVEMRLPYIPKFIHLECQPYLSGLVIQYQDGDDVQQTLSSTEYDIDDFSAPTKIKVFRIPTISCDTKVNPVVITYVAGYGAAVTDVPESLREATLILATKMEAIRVEPSKALGLIGNLIEPYTQHYARV